jgi:hypothetical protein
MKIENHTLIVEREEIVNILNKLEKNYQNDENRKALISMIYRLDDRLTLRQKSLLIYNINKVIANEPDYFEYKNQYIFDVHFTDVARRQKKKTIN